MKYLITACLVFVSLYAQAQNWSFTTPRIGYDFNANIIEVGIGHVKNIPGTIWFHGPSAGIGLAFPSKQTTVVPKIGYEIIKPISSGSTILSLFGVGGRAWIEDYSDFNRNEVRITPEIVIPFDLAILQFSYGYSFHMLGDDININKHRVSIFLYLPFGSSSWKNTLHSQAL